MVSKVRVGLVDTAEGPLAMEEAIEPELFLDEVKGRRPGRVGVVTLINSR